VKRMTIDIGIDLGTTNSEIGILRGTEVDIIKNNEGSEYTPSAVWFDAKNRLWVGRQAKEASEADPDNSAIEFKLQMGTTEEKHFVRSGKRMKPEELSADVLKSLRASVKQKINEDCEAAVITVPAAFELPQCDATNRAAQLAGIKQSPLLQEPVAAALAYGFQSMSDRVFWLVYDLGGGTFDSAVIQVRDGVIQWVNHEGDNQLGGKLIDWAIVDDLLVPAVAKESRLTDFHRGDKRWLSAIAKLKHEAEEAKIRLSDPMIGPATDITIDFWPKDNMGELVHFEYELKRADVEKLAEPIIARSINICRKVLGDKRLGPEHIEKIILVGGPTLMPYLRDRLSEKDKGLGIPLEFRIDPLTVVARGAAIFAGTQRIKIGPVQQVVEGQFSIELDYKPMGPDVEPNIGGKISSTQIKDFSGFTIEFINSGAKPPWRSGKLGLGPDGTFRTTLWAEKGHANTFEIELCDQRGRRVTTAPDSFVYTVGMVITDQQLTSSMGVALASNEMCWYFEKGMPLPLRRREFFKTAFEVRQGKEGDLIRILVMEGDILRANRNNKIGEFLILSKDIKRDVPIGSDVEVTLVIDESRLVNVQAFIPILDENYEITFDMKTYEQIDVETVEKEFSVEKARLAELRRKVETIPDSSARKILNRIDEERMIPEVEKSLVAASADPDARTKAKHRLADLKIALDGAEDAVEWPLLVSEAEDLIPSVKTIIQEHGNNADIRTFDNLETEIQKAIKVQDPDILRKRIEDLRNFAYSVLDRKGIMQASWFESLCKMKEEMRDRIAAEQLISQGQRAMANNDVDDLRSVNRQLAALLPMPPPPPDISTLL